MGTDAQRAVVWVAVEPGANKAVVYKFIKPDGDAGFNPRGEGIEPLSNWFVAGWRLVDVRFDTAAERNASVLILENDNP